MRPACLTSEKPQKKQRSRTVQLFAVLCGFSYAPERLFLVILAVFLLIGGLAGEVHSQTLDGVRIHAGQDDRGVHVAALELGELLQSDSSRLILGGRAGQRDQDLIGVQAGIPAAEVVGLEGLDGLDGAGGDQVDLMVDAGQLLEGVEQGRRGCAQQGTVLAGDDSAVRQLDGGSGCAAGALGHGVSSLDGTQLLMMQSGYLVRSSVAEIRAGTRGTPGELHGLFDVTDTVGTVDKNTACGIFGTMTHPRQGQTVETAPAESVVTGPAEILSNVDGDQVQRFAIRIDRVDADAKNGRNLLITVTDEALLAKTGGIVQGMSGSPILQNGRLVGAVTHVLVNSPAQGYGILIDRMLQAAEG